MRSNMLAGLFAAVLLTVVAAAPAAASFPGGNGQIAVTSQRDGNAEIYLVTPSGQTQVRLTDNPADDTDPAFSADGSKIAFVSDRDGDNEVYVMNADGTGQTRVTNHAGDDLDPAFSPDGTRLLIRRNVDGNNEIFEIDADDGDNAVNLSNHEASDFEPEFSPDGTKIVFQRFTGGSGDGLGNEVFLMNADGSEQVNLTSNPNTVNDGRPSFSPDGSRIAFDSNRNDSRFEIYTTDLEGGEPERITSIETGGTQEPAYSPDGSMVAFRTAGTDATGISMVDSPGGSASVITSETGDSSPAWQPDSEAPVTQITGGPAAGSTTTDTEPEFTFGSDEPESTFECRLGAADWGACTSPHQTAALADGEHTFSVRATDIAGNVEAEPASRTFTVDTTAPTVEITGAPPLISGSTEQAFGFVADEPGTTAECRLDPADDSAVWVACVSPVTYTGLVEGPHRFEVRATDASGHTGPPAFFEWKVETTPPGVTIISGPSATTTEISAWFGFTSDNPDAGFECRLDPVGPGGWTPCTTGVEYNDLADGTHDFEVRAVGQGAGPGTAASRSWTVDTVAPAVAISSGPQQPTNETDAEFVIAVNKPGYTLECQIDAEPATACTSPVSYTDLAPGEHSFVVEAADGDGNVIDSALWQWTILAAAPTATISSGPPAVSSSNTAVFNFHSDVPEAVFECRVDGGDWVACTSPSGYPALGDGAHDFEVRALLNGSVAGPVAGSGWSVDTVAPVVTVAGGPSATTKAADASFSIGADDDQASVECSLDGAPWSTCGGETSFSGLADGSHTLRVRAVDVVGNTGLARRDWSVDRTPPVTTIGSGPDAETTSFNARLTFSADDPAATFECRLDGSEWKACSSAHQVRGLNRGNHRFAVRATDQLGNTGRGVQHRWRIVAPAPKGLVPKLTLKRRIQLDRDGTAKLATVKCPEGRCRVIAPKRAAFRLRGKRFTPGIKSPRGWYTERTSEVMLITSAGTRRVVRNHGPVKIKVKLTVESDNGKRRTVRSVITLVSRR